MLWARNYIVSRPWGMALRREPRDGLNTAQPAIPQTRGPVISAPRSTCSSSTPTPSSGASPKNGSAASAPECLIPNSRLSGQQAETVAPSIRLQNEHLLSATQESRRKVFSHAGHRESEELVDELRCLLSTVRWNRGVSGCFADGSDDLCGKSGRCGLGI